MERLATAEYKRDEDSECVGLLSEYVNDEDLSDIALAVGYSEQLAIEDEVQEDKNSEVMTMYLMILEEELDTEKQKTLRLQKLNQEAEKERLDIEERNKELIKQKHTLEAENQQLRQRLWKVKDLFRKSADEVWELRRQNRKLHEMLEIRNSSVDCRRESDNAQIARRFQALKQQVYTDTPQRKSYVGNGTAQPSMQRFSSEHMLHRRASQRGDGHLLRDFIALKQTQQNRNDEESNATDLEGKSKPDRPAAEGDTEPELADAAEEIGFDAEQFNIEEIPIKPAPLSEDLLLLLGDRTESCMEAEHKDIRDLETRNSNLEKALQKLEMQHSELKCHQHRLSMAFNNLKRQDPVEQIRTEISKRNILRKVHSGCHTKEEALLKSVRNGTASIVRQVISEGADVNLTIMGKWTPLHIAAAYGDPDICEELLDAGALRNITDRWGDTPLHWAAVNGHQQAASVLVHRGADVSRRGRGDKTPREKALAAGHDDLADWFAKKEREQLQGNSDP